MRGLFHAYDMIRVLVILAFILCWIERDTYLYFCKIYFVCNFFFFNLWVVKKKKNLLYNTTIL